MPSIIVLANPAAGKGRCAHHIQPVREKLEQVDLDFKMIETEGPLHAVELARQASLDGADIVAAMGGDGTVNEVLNGLMQARGDGGTASLAVLEAGRGNDFGYGAGVPHNLDADCRLLSHGQHHAIDVLEVSVDDGPARYVGNGVGIGFDAKTGFVAARHKVLTGFPSYLVAALKTLFFEYTLPKVRITLDDESWTQHALMVSLMNGQRMGGGFYMAPEAQPDDGLIDACIVGSDKKLKLLMLMLDFLKGTQVGKPQVIMRQGKRVVVEALEGSLPAHGDGETLCEAGNKLALTIHHQALRVVRAEA